MTAPGLDLHPLLRQYAADLPALFIVSQVQLEHGTDNGVSIEIQRAEGTKCERCWKYTLDVGSDPGISDACARPVVMPSSNTQRLVPFLIAAVVVLLDRLTQGLSIKAQSPLTIRSL